VTEQFAVNVGVRNLFDEKPTAIGDVQEQANTFPETYDVIGRRYVVSGTYNF
jgi:outer membrane receptor for ferrienterochelin and colicin